MHEAESLRVFGAVSQMWSSVRSWMPVEAPIRSLWIGSFPPAVLERTAHQGPGLDKPRPALQHRRLLYTGQPACAGIADQQLRAKPHHLLAHVSLQFGFGVERWSRWVRRLDAGAGFSDQRRNPGRW